MDDTPSLNRVSESSSDDGSGPHQSSPKHKRTLDSTDCTKDWMPREIQSLLGVQDIAVVRISRDSRGLKKDLGLSDIVGLTVICSAKTHDRKNEPAVVCLTSKDSIYVFQPNIESHAIFLKHMLDKRQVKFFTRDGIWDADTLYRHTKIDLRDHHDHCLDLASFDIHLTLSKHIYQKNKPISKYSMTYVHNQVKPKHNTFEELVNKWLGVDLNLDCTEEEIDSIRKEPDSIMSKNAIKKRAVLVQALAERMFDEFENMRDQPSRNIFAFAKNASSSLMEDYCRSGDQTYSKLIHALDSCE